MEAKIRGFDKPRLSRFPSILAMDGEQAVDYGEGHDSNHDRRRLTPAKRIPRGDSICDTSTRIEYSSPVDEY
jgi:hypothetical protein